MEIRIQIARALSYSLAEAKYQLAQIFTNILQSKLIKMNIQSILSALLLTISIATAKDTEWISLFDGKTTNGWTPRVEVIEFKAVDGELHLISKKNVWVVSDLKLGDFILEAEAKMPEGKINSGIGFRLTGDTGKPKGYQCEIMDAIPGKNGGMYGIGIGGWIYPAKGQEAEFEKRVKNVVKRNDWNKYKVHCEGKRIRIYVNDKLITDTEHDKNLSGAFGIQHHGGNAGMMKFRNLRVKKL